MRWGEKSTTEATQRDREPKITEAKQHDRRGGSSSRRVQWVQLTKSARGGVDDEIPWC